VVPHDLSRELSGDNKPEGTFSLASRAVCLIGTGQKKENKWMNDVLQAIDRTRLSPVEKRERRNELLSGEKNWWYPAIFPTLFGPHGPPDENWSCDSEVDRFEQARLLAIIPSEPIELLPSLGTLNFFARKAQRLIRLGYRDSLRAVCDEAHGRALV
jgi:hypothetical protein